MAIDSLRKARADDEVRERIRVTEKARWDFATAIAASCSGQDSAASAHPLL